MGNSSSAQKPQTQEQKDIKYLGDRVPFGDGELRRLYRCYYALEELPPKERLSFLSDWFFHADLTATEEQRDERALLMQVVEAKMLPIGFGNRLYATAFLKKGEASIYEDETRFTVEEEVGDNDNQKNAEPPGDEYTRMTKLEQFFEGLSNCGRRGTKNAIKVLVECCEAVSVAEGEDPLIRANELIQVTYRIALGAAFLASANKSKDEEDDEDNNMMRFLPADDKLSQQELESFASSIVDHRNTRRVRSGDPPLPSGEEMLVSEEDVLSWVNDEVPLLASTLSTFIWRIFSPGRSSDWRGMHHLGFSDSGETPECCQMVFNILGKVLSPLSILW